MTRLDPDAWPASRAIDAARATGVTFEVHGIERPRSLEDAARRLGIAPEQLLKTLVVRRAADDHLLVLVPGTAQLSWPKLRAHLGVSRLSLPDADEAREATGYERGTITPFGAELPVLADASIRGAGSVTVGSGVHGVSLRLDADELLAAVDAEVVDLT